MQKDGEAELRRLYKEVFGDQSETKLENGVDEFQKKLEEHVFKNGGQLRDYQAEGVSWMMNNYVNKRSSILADEMGTLASHTRVFLQYSILVLILTADSSFYVLRNRSRKDHSNCVLYQSTSNATQS